MKRPLTDRDVATLLELAAAADWRLPRELGDAPHYRDTLIKLWQHGLAESRPRAGTRRFREYRPTAEGHAVLRDMAAAA